jgi:hypothetical protein
MNVFRHLLPSSRWADVESSMVWIKLAAICYSERQNPHSPLADRTETASRFLIHSLNKKV